MKKTLFLTLILFLSFTFSSCNGNKEYSFVSADNFDYNYDLEIEDDNSKILFFTINSNSSYRNDVYVKNNKKYVVSYYNVINYYTNEFIEIMMPNPLVVPQTFVDYSMENKEIIYMFYYEMKIEDKSYDIVLYDSRKDNYFEICKDKFMSPLSHFLRNGDIDGSNTIFQLNINNQNQVITDNKKYALKSYSKENFSKIEISNQFEEYEKYNIDFSNIDFQVDYNIDFTNYIISKNAEYNEKNRVNYALITSADDFTKNLGIDDEIFEKYFLVIIKSVFTSSFDFIADNYIIDDNNLYLNQLVNTSLSVNDDYMAKIEIIKLDRKYLDYNIFSEMIFCIIHSNYFSLSHVLPTIHVNNLDDLFVELS